MRGGAPSGCTHAARGGGWRCDVPRAVLAALDGEIARLHPQARALVQGAAVADDPFDLASVGAAAALGETAALAAHGRAAALLARRGARTEVDGIDQAGNGQVILNDLTVQAGLSNVRVTALEDQDGCARAWQVKATAICASA